MVIKLIIMADSFLLLVFIEVSAQNLDTHHGCVERKRTKEKGSKTRDEKEEARVKREREEMSAVRGSPPVSWQTNACH